MCRADKRKTFGWDCASKFRLLVCALQAQAVAARGECFQRKVSDTLKRDLIFAANSIDRCIRAYSAVMKKFLAK